MIESVAYPRAALIGNPSDGYFGKTIAFVFKNFIARVNVQESELLEIKPGARDVLQFADAQSFSNSINTHGYYGGVRLLQATLKKFFDYCREQSCQPDRNFTISYNTTIPERLGMAGSSAIITAAMNALLQFYEVEISKPVLANLVLSAEKDELKIGAGLQDRVAQVYACPVYMNFDKALMQQRGYGEYLPFKKELLPEIYIAYRNTLAEGSEITHNDLAERFARKELAVKNAVAEWQHLTEQVWEKLQSGDQDIGALLNRNFDIRKKILRISEGNLQLIKAARATGASAKFTGSGGAIIGTYENTEMLEKLKIAMREIGAEVMIPDIL